MAVERISIETPRGPRLAGILDLPITGQPKAFAVFAHCFTCTKNIRAAARISRALNASGIAVLRFDFTGLGESEGDFAETSFSTNVEDLIAAAAFLETHYEPAQLLVGHSLGGTAMLMAAPKIPSSRAVAIIGSPSEPAHVEQHLAGGRAEILARGEATVDIGGRPFRIRRQFLEDLAAQSLGDRLRALRRALLILHAPMDRIVSIDNAAEIFARALHPKSFVSLDEADHLLSDPADAAYAGAVIAAWSSRYLVPRDTGRAPGDAADATATTGRRGFTTALQLGEHALIADEPADVGGQDLGPSPYGLLAAALAGCTSMTLQMYARHKGLPLESATVSVKHGRIHAKDCEDCESLGGRVDEFVREIRLDGELDAASRQRLVEIADKCPVHRTLTGEIRIRNRLSD